MAMTRADGTSERLRSNTSQRRDPQRDQRHDPPTSADTDADVETLTQREANLFHLLAHPARLALLDALRDDAACVCHLEALLGYPQAYVSQQLAVLRAAGLIEGRREGWNVYYHVRDARLFTVLDAALNLLSPSGSTEPERSTKREPGSAAPGCACPHCATSAAASSDRQEAL